MPKDTSIQTILLLGSGPITIGQACEFDYSGTQALRALKAEGYRVILVNSNPATIMTDPELPDQVYIEPLNVDFLEMIIAKEKPDALLPTMGGQTALNLAVQLAEKGILKKYNVRLLGAQLESIHKAEDRDLFKKTMIELGIDVPKSSLVHTLDEGYKALKEIGLPIILRPSFTLGGEGGGIAYTEKEFEQILKRGLFLSPTSSVLIEESLLGWKEFELEVVRDKKDNVIIVCTIENLDPMGVHTGDSITVAPAQTLSDKQFQHLRDLSKKIIRAINVDTGGSNIQFAIKPFGPDAGRTIVIEMNPRVSRSSALASKATGFPIAKIAAKLAVGYTLDELKNEITNTTPASFEPTIDYVVTKIPRFDFEKFVGPQEGDQVQKLSTQMKSVGEVMAIGKNFRESFMKALSSLENNFNSLCPTEYDHSRFSNSDLEEKLKEPFWTRIWYVISAMRRGFSTSQISTLTKIDPWFLDQILEIVQLEQYLKSKPFKEWSDRDFIVAKQFGFSDKNLATLIERDNQKNQLQVDEFQVSTERIRRNIKPYYSLVDTCAGEFQANTPYLYSTYNATIQHNPTQHKSKKKAVLILGSGPNRIGQGIEFDYCCVHASQAVLQSGIESVMINCNPETVSTDYDVSSRLYFEPLTTESVYSIYNELTQLGYEIIGSIVQFGGQTPLKLSGSLHKLGIPILGTSVESIDIAEDRKRFDSLMEDLKPLGLQQPLSRIAHNKTEALNAAKEMGYPIMLRPSYVLGGRGMRIVFNEEGLLRYIHNAIQISDSRSVLMDRFLSDAIEVDVDAISDGNTVLIAGIMEHIEEAGIHSGDSACSLPPFNLSTKVTAQLREFTKILAKKLNVIGLMNVQFAVKDSTVYVLEVNPRASRTIPFVSKAIGVPLAKLATQVMLGQTFEQLGFNKDMDLAVTTYNVKMPVFPFHKFPGVDVLLGPEMKSTGEAMGRSFNFAGAYAKSLLAASINIPTKGRAFLSIADSDKPGIIEIAAKLIALGFELDATPGTYAFLKKHEILSQSVAKVGQETPNCVDFIRDKRYQLILNTTNDEKAIIDSVSIRRTALENKIPYCTLLTTARAFIKAIQTVQSQHFILSPLKEDRPL